MSDKRKKSGLHAYHKWQSANLDEARVEMGRRVDVAQKKLSALNRIEHEISESQNFARERTESHDALQVDSLRRMVTFATYQRTELDAARLARNLADREVDTARDEVISMHQRLSVVERLLERRAESATKELQQTLQKQLDEGALTRGPHASVNEAGQE